MNKLLAGLLASAVLFGIVGCAQAAPKASATHKIRSAGKFGFKWLYVPAGDVVLFYKVRPTAKVSKVPAQGNAHNQQDGSWIFIGPANKAPSGGSKTAL